jgi:hypothetical protein
MLIAVWTASFPCVVPSFSEVWQNHQENHVNVAVRLPPVHPCLSHSAMPHIAGTHATHMDIVGFLSDLPPCFGMPGAIVQAQDAIPISVQIHPDLTKHVGNINPASSMMPYHGIEDWAWTAPIPDRQGYHRIAASSGKKPRR